MDAQHHFSISPGASTWVQAQVPSQSQVSGSQGVHKFTRESEKTEANRALALISQVFSSIVTEGKRLSELKLSGWRLSSEPVKSDSTSQVVIGSHIQRSKTQETNPKLVYESQQRQTQILQQVSSQEPVKGGLSTFDVEATISKLGTYDLPKNAVDDKDYINNLPDKAKKALFEGTKTPSETTKREEFVRALHTRMEELKKSGDEIPVEIEALLGSKELVNLYKKALKEEADSVEFREAVFRQSSTKTHEWPKGIKKLVLYIGGPSASGKSFGQKVLFKFLLKKYGSVQTEVPQYLVSVDGGNPRALSQIRQLTLNVALDAGYSGIKDLHENSSLPTKKYVHAAAKEGGDNFHTVLPQTFLDPTEAKNFILDLKKTLNNSKITQIHANIEGGESFKDTIGWNGESRAWGKKGESKEFHDNTNLGVRASSWIKSIAKELLPSKNIITLESDDLHVDKEGNRITKDQITFAKEAKEREELLWKEVSSTRDIAKKTLAFERYLTDLNIHNKTQDEKWENKSLNDIKDNRSLQRLLNANDKLAFKRELVKLGLHARPIKPAVEHISQREVNLWNDLGKETTPNGKEKVLVRYLNDLNKNNQQVDSNWKDVKIESLNEGKLLQLYDSDTPLADFNALLSELKIKTSPIIKVG